MPARVFSQFLTMSRIMTAYLGWVGSGLSPVFFLAAAASGFFLVTVVLDFLVAAVTDFSGVLVALVSDMVPIGSV